MHIVKCSWVLTLSCLSVSCSVVSIGHVVYCRNCLLRFIIVCICYLFVFVIVFCIIFCFNVWSCGVVISVSISTFRSWLHNHRNVSSSLKSCLSLFLLYLTCITLLFHSLLKDTLDFAFMCCMYPFLVSFFSLLIVLLLLLLIHLSQAFFSWHFSWTNGDPHSSFFNFQTAVLVCDCSIICDIASIAYFVANWFCAFLVRLPNCSLNFLNYYYYYHHHHHHHHHYHHLHHHNHHNHHLIQFIHFCFGLPTNNPRLSRL